MTPAQTDLLRRLKTVAGPAVAAALNDAADALAAMVRERDEARAEAGRATRDYLDRCQAVERLTAERDAARAQVATLRDGLSKIARYRAECLAYDADTGREPRSFDKEDVRLIEGMARSLLSHVGATAPAERGEGGGE